MVVQNHTTEQSKRMVFVSFASSEYSRSATILNSAEATNYNFEYFEIRSNFVGSLWEIYRILQKSKSTSTVFIVCSPSHLLTIPLRVFSSHPIVLDAGWPLSDHIQSSNVAVKRRVEHLKNHFIDWVSFSISSLVFLETEEQIKFICSQAKRNTKKYALGYTGLNESAFENIFTQQPIELKGKLEKNYILFRGKLNEEAGIKLILDVIKLMPEYNFVISSPNIKDDLSFDNLVIIKRYISNSEIKYLYENSVLTIGQMGIAQRIQKTIPHKAFESAYFGIPYLTQMTPAILELYPSSKHAFFLNELSAEGIAAGITEAMLNKDLSEQITKNSSTHYRDNFSQEVTARSLFSKILKN